MENSWARWGAVGVWVEWNGKQGSWAWCWSVASLDFRLTGLLPKLSFLLLNYSGVLLWFYVAFWWTKSYLSICPYALSKNAVYFTSSVTLLFNWPQLRFFPKGLVAKNTESEPEIWSWLHHYLCAHRKVASPPYASSSLPLLTLAI